MKVPVIKIIQLTKIKITNTGKLKPVTKFATIVGILSNASIHMYILDNAIIIITLALVLIVDISKEGIFLILSPRIIKKPTIKAYNTPIPADSVAVAIPSTTAPITKTGMINASIDCFILSNFSFIVSLISSFG